MCFPTMQHLFELPKNTFIRDVFDNFWKVVSKDAFGVNYQNYVDLDEDVKYKNLLFRDRINRFWTKLCHLKLRSRFLSISKF